MSECFKCHKDLQEVFKDTNQYLNAVEFIGVGAYGSIYDMDKFSIQICDECLCDVPKKDDYFQEKIVEFKCKHCKNPSDKLLRTINGLFCDQQCRNEYCRSILGD